MAEIHPTAIIAPGAQLGEDVEVGAYSVIGPHVSIGDRTTIMPHVFIDGHTTLGAECRVFPFASLGTQTQDLKYSGGVTRVEIGDRTTLREYVTVNSATDDGDCTRVGSDCLIMAYAHVAHDCLLGNQVIVANACALAGHIVIEDQVIIGGLVGIHQFVRIGQMCIIGGCSKVTQDVPPYMMADGHPLAVRGINSIGLKRRGVSADVRKQLKEVYRILYRRDLTTSRAVDAIEEEIESSEEIRHVIDFVKGSERGIAK
ncbi:MAG: acyl-ACP--UDP-N-acetylglucosamine O-acyltransferase [Spartobacteria bacterium]|nr:acyl-ACP--UDP-N-acetylglucosamine O-acyltransferase [Spartobacteria bacterium]